MIKPKNIQIEKKIALNLIIFFIQNNFLNKYKAMIILQKKFANLPEEIFRNTSKEDWCLIDTMLQAGDKRARICIPKTIFE